MMSEPQPKIAIAAMGVVTPLGHGILPFWQALSNGQNAFRLRPEFADSDSPYRLAAPIVDFDGKHWIKPRKALKVMSLPIQFGCAAAQMASDDCPGWSAHENPELKSVVVGSNAIYADPPELAPAFARCRVDGSWDIKRWGQEFTAAVPPLWMLQYLPNMAAAHISIAHDARGPSNSICQENCSSLLALIEASLLLERGWADVAIAGGTGSLTSITGMVYRGIQSLAAPVNSPDQVLGPFAYGRSGQIIGEGAGMMVLGTRNEGLVESHGQPMPYLRGWARGFCHPEAGRFPTQLAELIRQALDQAQLKVSDLGHINAHAAGLPTLDLWEAQAIAAVVGRQIPVIAWKSYFGNLGAGSGAVELIASILCWRHGCLLPTLSRQGPDPECPIWLLTAGMPQQPKPFLKISLDATGQAVVVVISPD